MSNDPRVTLADARERLGGRVLSHGRAGEIVRVGDVVGVVLHSDASFCDVWTLDDRARRVAVAEIAPEQDARFADAAMSAREFARLEEGSSVVFDGTTQGRLIEKCRWGGLVARADGRIFAVGFRRFARMAS